METILELLSTIGRFLVGLWPVMFIMVLVGIFKRKEGFKTMLRTSIKALIFSWVFLAVLRAVFFFLKLETFKLIPEPANSIYFLLVGMLLLPLVCAIVLEERRHRFIIKSIEDMQGLSASEFEHLVADTYRDQGNQVEVIGASGDHGIDLVITSRKGETWIVQCKKYRGKVGEPIVRDFYGTLRASNASAGAIITTGYFTDQARLWAEGKPIHLYDGREFLKIIEATRYRRNLPIETRKRVIAVPIAEARNAAQTVALKNALQPAMEAAYAAPVAAAPVYTAPIPAPVAVPVYPAAPVAASKPMPDIIYASAVQTAAAVEMNDETELPDKTPFMEMSNVPDCPVCGIPMVEKTAGRFPFKQKKIYVCANAPACDETFPVE